MLRGENNRLGGAGGVVRGRPLSEPAWKITGCPYGDRATFSGSLTEKWSPL